MNSVAKSAEVFDIYTVTTRVQNLTKFVIKSNNKLFNLKTTRTYLGPRTKCTHCLYAYLIGKKLKGVQVNFVVNTVVIQYCVYYEIYLNSL